MRVYPRRWWWPGNGATELIHNICRYTAGRRILVPAPGFGEYAAAAELCGSPVGSYEGGVPSGGMPRNSCVFVCNPSNPVGVLTGRHTILEAASEAARVDSMLIVDECFIEMTPGCDESVVPYAERHKNMVVLRSLTKSFGLAGLRAGYCIADPTISAILRRIRMPWSVNALGAGRRYRITLAPRTPGGGPGCDTPGDGEPVPGPWLTWTGLNRIAPTPTTWWYAPPIRPPLSWGGFWSKTYWCGIAPASAWNHHIRISVKTPDKNKILLDGPAERMPCMMVQGTMSGAGKSTLVTALCRILSDMKYDVAPFKSQNMSGYVSGGISRAAGNTGRRGPPPAVPPHESHNVGPPKRPHQRGV